MTTPRRSAGAPALHTVLILLALLVGTALVVSGHRSERDRTPAADAAATDAAAEATGIEGRYETLDPPLPQATGPIEVVEVFWYGCPHCYTFLPVMEAFESSLPGDVDARRLPAVFGDRQAAHARAYHAARMLGAERTLHRAIFEAIHEDGHPTDDAASLADRFADHGITRAAFERAYRSPEVDALLEDDARILRQSAVASTPTLIVAGRYRVGRLARSQEDIAIVAGTLVERERAARTASAAP